MDTGVMSEPVGPGPNTGLPLDARASWLFTALFLLTAATGMVDATSFLGLGQVFTANMTGNVLLLGFAVASRAVAHQYGLSAVGGLISLAAFTAGAVIGGLAAGRRSRAPRLAMALVVEWVVLVGATVLVGVDPHPGTEARFVAIALLAMAMGVQNATVRRMGVPDVNTTVLTTTLGGLAADVVEVGGRPARAGRRVA